MNAKDSHYGQHLKCFEKIFACRGKAVFQALTRKSATSFNSEDKTSTSPHLTSYFGGHYRKYEGKLEGRSYIIKLSKPEYPEICSVEFVCNKIAYDFGLFIPAPFTLLDFGGEEHAFVSRNFMDNQTSHATLNHLYHYLPEGEKHYNVEEIASTIYQETKSVEDYKQFFRMLLFDALIGNHDRHGRNLAFIETAAGKRLSPIYDNPSAIGLESGAFLKMQHEPRGKIWTADSQEPTMKEYLQEMKRLKQLNYAEQILHSVDFEKILSRISESCSLSQDMKDAFTKLITKRYKEFYEFIKNKND